MARVLIVGCGCRGRALGAGLVADGHAVRGTSRGEAGRDAIAGAGFEAAIADPLALGTILPALAGVSALVWLMGTAAGEGAAELHASRLESMLAKVVDTPVRGVVYERAGTVDSRTLASGAALVRAAGGRHRMPVALISADPADHAAWITDARAAVSSVL